ncbi:unnamed protein product [Owenia fusiformis]|uniref:C-type lectin domain-containing protein n=1 Tax=Owenia fusiformis TaxID=6347 RepID=A0A8S4PJV3_OWEFU|nr:unnamed protein product [Owenia fusiformis]
MIQFLVMYGMIVSTHCQLTTTLTNSSYKQAVCLNVFSEMQENIHRKNQEIDKLKETTEETQQAMSELVADITNLTTQNTRLHDDVQEMRAWRRTGRKGDTDSPGMKGSKGSPGSPGINGIPGSPGLKGSPGSPGMKGNAGFPGLQGIPGSPGMKGNPGSQGIKGSTGSPGINARCRKETRCPVDFTQNQRSCYLFVHSSGAATTWFQANSFCFSHSAHLVAIESSSEHQYIVNRIRGYGAKNYWTGGNNLAGGYMWSGGPCFTAKPVVYTKWVRGEPSGGHEKCIHLWNHRSLDWNDAPCTDNMNFICEINL